jgi:prolyl oligopeptidase
MSPSFPLLIAATMIATTAQAQSMTYPETRKVEQVDTYHGNKVADPYRWLEDDNSAETKEWVKAQNAITNRYLEALPQRLPTQKLYTDLYNFEKFGIPFSEGGKYFYTRNDGLQQQAVLYMVKNLKDTPQIAIDPNTLSKDGTVALTGTAVSRDGKYLAYGTAGGGSDWQEWKVRDLATGKDLADTIKWVKFSSAAWTADGKGFFYSRYDAPKEGAALTGANYNQKLFYHRLGTTQDKDLLVHQDEQDKERGFSGSVSDDGKLLLIYVWKGSARKNGLLWLPLKNGAYVGGKPQTLTLAFDAEYAPIGSNGNTLWIRSDAGAPKGHVVAVDLTKPDRKNWKTIVGEQKDALTSASVVGGQVFAQYLKDAASLVRVHTTAGKPVREVALPGVGTASGFAGRFDRNETFFSYTSLTAPATIYRLDVKTGKATLFKKPTTAFDTDSFETRREFVTSKDGTKVPIFIAHRKGIKLDGSNPVLLYAYGGFNVSETPTYRVTAATWLKMGGVYVTASLRGGGEYGAEWHEAGTKLRKQNVFDDFIAAGEWLIANKYTSASKLAINGGSNGGLLVGAVLNQRPELFGAAIPQVGVMDMLRFHKFTIGWAWVSDYGSSDKEDEFKAIYKYSPLHNARRNVAYPPVLVTTADHDDRVVPAHSFKYTAEMQSAANEYLKNGGKNTGPILVRIETQAGHGAGTPTSKIIEERSDILAFVANALGLAFK